jgi:hypothetical protein
MTGRKSSSLVIVFPAGQLLLLLLSGAAGAGLTPADMLANFCPCVDRPDCSLEFGADGQEGLQAILEVRPYVYLCGHPT